MRRLLQLTRLLCLTLTLASIAVAVVWRHYPAILGSIDRHGIKLYVHGANDRSRAASELAKKDPEAAITKLEALSIGLSSFQKHDRLFGARQHAVRLLVDIAMRAGHPERGARAMLGVLDDYPKDLSFALMACELLLLVGRDETTEEGRRNLQELFDWLPTVSGIAKAHAIQLAQQGRQSDLVDALRAHLAHVDHPIEAAQNLMVPWRISWATDESDPMGSKSPVEPIADNRQVAIPFRVPKGHKVLRVELPSYCIAELTNMELRLTDGEAHVAFSLSDLHTEPSGVFLGDGASISCDGPRAVRFSVRLPRDLSPSMGTGRLVADVSRLPRWLSAYLSGPVGRILSQEAREADDSMRYALLRREWALARSTENLVLSGPEENQTFALTPGGDQLSFDCEWTAAGPCGRLRLTFPAGVGDTIVIDDFAINTTAGRFTAAPFDGSGPVQWYGVANGLRAATVTSDRPYLEWTPDGSEERVTDMSIQGSLR